jgi:hypothetical protein
MCNPISQESLAVPWCPPALDQETVAELFGPTPDARTLRALQHEVAAAIAQLRFEAKSGNISLRVCTVAGLPLACWLPASSLVALLRELDGQ